MSLFSSIFTKYCFVICIMFFAVGTGRVYAVDCCSPPRGAVDVNFAVICLIIDVICLELAYTITESINLFQTHSWFVLNSLTFCQQLRNITVPCRNLTLAALQGNVLTHVRWSEFWNHVIQHSAIRPIARFDGNSWAAVKLY